MSDPGRDMGPTAGGGAPLVRVRGLTACYRAGRRTCIAVDGVDLDVPAGCTVGLVGESGCGKTTLGRAILRLTPVASGSVHLGEMDVLALRGGELRRFRRRVQMIFQDSLGSLNPRMTVQAIVSDPLAAHRVASRQGRRERVAALLESVGLAADLAVRYPHELSGGQRQRVGIARALALEPQFMVCDEPIRALDAPAQNEILELLATLQRHRRLSYLFITHNLAAAERFCDRIAVMYLGRIVETGPAAEVVSRPLHPYTQALRAAVLPLDPACRGRLHVLRGEVPSPFAPPSGCAFHPRCPHATERCRRETPTLGPVSGPHPRWLAACFHAAEIQQSGRHAE